MFLSKEKVYQRCYTYSIENPAYKGLNQHECLEFKALQLLVGGGVGAHL